MWSDSVFMLLLLESRTHSSGTATDLPRKGNRARHTITHIFSGQVIGQDKHTQFHRYHSGHLIVAVIFSQTSCRVPGLIAAVCLVCGMQPWGEMIIGQISATSGKHRNPAEWLGKFCRRVHSSSPASFHVTFKAHLVSHLSGASERPHCCCLSLREFKDVQSNSLFSWTKKKRITP